MRIISGEMRGRVFRAPTGRDTRPTTDRVRESIFSSVFSHAGGVTGARVLDLFAGSGAMGFESLSRGAASVVAVESAGEAARVVLSNAASLGVQDRHQLVKRDALRSTGQLSLLGPYDIVFADPPYAVTWEAMVQVFGELASAGGLAPGALIVYEHGLGVELVWPEEFTAVQQKVHGTTAVSYALFRAEENGVRTDEGI